MTYVRMADAAFAANIPLGYEIAAGYYGGPEEFHQWAPSDWHLFPGYRLPIWVAGLDGAGEGARAVQALRALSVPAGSITAVDMETRKDITYLVAFGAQLAASGYRTWVYGSRSTVFGNPQLNGYWVAQYGVPVSETIGLLETPGVRAVQYAPDLPPGFDASLVRLWTEGEMWHG